MSQSIRVRFAPSPTGYLHIGGARTALFNWLFARHGRGIFILRLEDTDRARSEERFAESIYADLRWLGLDWDEGPDTGGPGGPYRQAERGPIYERFTETLLSKGLAYEEPGRTGEGKAVLFRVPPGATRFVDRVFGEIIVDHKEIKDQAVRKSDGSPTYNFAVTVDDAIMEITHVIRGKDHLSNTPKQILLARALGFSPPEYAHLPLMNGPDGTPLSKRHGDTAVGAFREAGYLPEAMLNYLARQGWSYDDRQEVFNRGELTEKFSLDRVRTSDAVFDTRKLEDLNALYLSRLNVSQRLEACLPFLRRDGFLGEDAGSEERAWWERAIGYLGDRLKKADQAGPQLRFARRDPLHIPEALRKEHLAGEFLPGFFKGLLDALKTAPDKMSKEDAERVVRAEAEKSGLKFRAIAQPLRVLLTGSPYGIGLFEIFDLLGKEKVRARLESLLKQQNA